MKQRLQCDNGHEWELVVGAFDATADFGPRCPDCQGIGRPARRMALPAGTDSETLRPASGGVGAESIGRPQVAGYEIVRELGRGGMGVVYLARHAKLNRLVALKMVLAGQHASERDRERFRREAEAVARLQHPNIVQIFEIGEADGRPYLALEYADGGTLAERLIGTPLPARDAAQPGRSRG